MESKNFNIKISEEDEKIIKHLRDVECINISQFIRKCLNDKYSEIINAKKREDKK